MDGGGEAGWGGRVQRWEAESKYGAEGSNPRLGLSPCSIPSQAIAFWGRANCIRHHRLFLQSSSCIRVRVKAQLSASALCAVGGRAPPRTVRQALVLGLSTSSRAAPSLALLLFSFPLFLLVFFSPCLCFPLVAFSPCLLVPVPPLQRPQSKPQPLVSLPSLTTQTLPPDASSTYDYIVVGGGTAGCVVASRLSAYLPERRVLVIEAGPLDLDLGHVLDLRQWLSLLGGDLDYDYGTTEQPMGNSHIRHSRAKVLGGCSHNTLISFRPFRHDMDRWLAQGCRGWDFDTMTRLIDQLRNTFQPVDARHRNQLFKDWVAACSAALGIPFIPDFNAEICARGHLSAGAGFFSVSYNPDDGRRSSASVAYLHPILRGHERRPNLTVLTDAHVSRVVVEGAAAVGVVVTLASGRRLTLRPRRETVLCAGAVDTPRLLLHSGLGPRAQLEALGILVVADLPGVGENLIDHPETIMWELNRPVPANQTTMDSDAGVFLRCETPDAAGADGDAADVMMHCYQIPFCLNTQRLGYPVVRDGYAFCMTPNIPRARSRGRIYLTSPDPAVKPALDFRYFTDPDGYDAATLVAGLRAARRIAEQPPFKHWLKAEVAPGPAVQTDAELSKYARRVAHTVYHPAGTTKMGDVARDPLAVVDPLLRVRGLARLRIADAGVFPEMLSINPMLTVLAVGERAAELIAMDDGWELDAKPARL